MSQHHSQEVFIRGSACKEALCCPSRLHFEALILSQSDLKYPCFLFPHFFFAESWFQSLKR